MMSVNIANALLKVGVVSHLCVTRVDGNLKSKLNKDIQYLFLNRKSTFDISAIQRLKKYIKLHNIDVVHAHSSSYFIISLVKIMYPKLKIIWHDHYGNSEDLASRKTQPLKYFSNKFYAIITVNQLLKNWSTQNLKTQKVYYLPNFASLADTSKQTTLKGNKDKRIVCVAGFRPQKDHLTLLKAFQIINKKHSDWTLHLVGNQHNDSYFQSVKSFIDENELSKVIFIYNKSTDIKNILSQATIGVLSSKSEGLPVSLLEYGLAGLPVVVTNVGECNEVLENGKYGLLVEPSNEKELATEIRKFIENNELRNKFATVFKKHIVENYSEEKIIHKLLNIYKNL